MRKQKISEIFNNIDTNFIEEAYLVNKTQNIKRNMWMKLGAVAACCALTVVLGVGIFQIGIFEKSNLPESTEFNNTDGLITDDSLTKTQTDKNNTNLPSDTQPPISSIELISLYDILSALKNSDIQNSLTQKFPEKFQPEYKKLFDTLSSSGYIYSVATTEDSIAEDAVTFYKDTDGKNLFYLAPYRELEDIGIKSYVWFRGELYMVFICNADPEVLTQSETITDYIRIRRLGLKILDEVGSGEKTICYMIDGNEKHHAASFLDDTHFYIINAVSAETSQDELKALIDVISFDKIYLE